VTLYQAVIRLPTLLNTLESYEGQFGDDIKSKFTAVRVCVCVCTPSMRVCECVFICIYVYFESTNVCVCVCASQVVSNLVADFAMFEQMVEKTVDMAALARHEYLVNATFSPELTALAAQKWVGVV
jgi:hypothetical protein